MKINDIQRALLEKAREHFFQVIEQGIGTSTGGQFLCLVLNDVEMTMADAAIDLGTTSCDIFTASLEMKSAIREAIALNGASTMESWADEQMMQDIGVDLNLCTNWPKNCVAYRMRLAWIDRILETGEIK